MNWEETEKLWEQAYSQFMSNPKRFWKLGKIVVKTFDLSLPDRLITALKLHKEYRGQC